MATSKNPLFIPGKNTNTAHPTYGTDMRAIERWSQNVGGPYASLTGTGETTPTGTLTQAGTFNIEAPSGGFNVNVSGVTMRATGGVDITSETGGIDISAHTGLTLGAGTSVQFHQGTPPHVSGATPTQALLSVLQSIGLIVNTTSGGGGGGVPDLVWAAYSVNASSTGKIHKAPGSTTVFHWGTPPTSHTVSRRGGTTGFTPFTISTTSTGDNGRIWRLTKSTSAGLLVTIRYEMSWALNATNETDPNYFYIIGGTSLPSSSTPPTFQLAISRPSGQKFVTPRTSGKLLPFTQDTRIGGTIVNYFTGTTGTFIEFKSPRIQAIFPTGSTFGTPLVNLKATNPTTGSTTKPHTPFLNGSYTVYVQKVTT